MLKKYLPPYLFFINEIQQIIHAEQIELDLLDARIQDLVNQCFVLTATWGLDLWEQSLDIKIDITKDINFRRTSVIAKIRGQGVTTKAMIKNVVESFSNGEVDVIEHNSDYEFIIKFVGTKGIPPNLNDLRQAIEDIKPTHLAFDFEYTYNTWNMIIGTWQGVSTNTWEQLRTI